MFSFLLFLLLFFFHFFLRIRTRWMGWALGWVGWCEVVVVTLLLLLSCSDLQPGCAAQPVRADHQEGDQPGYCVDRARTGEGQTFLHVCLPSWSLLGLASLQLSAVHPLSPFPSFCLQA